MADNTVDVKLLLDIKEATQSVEGFTKSLKGLAALAASAFAAAKVGQFIGDIVAESSAAEDALQDLGVAFSLAGNFSQAAIDDFSAFASEIQKTTKFSDEAVLSAGALLEQMTRLDNEGLKQATQAALDLSSAMKIDLDTASRLVGKAAEGNVEAFKRYGIEIQKGKSDTETFSNTLRELSDRFGGAASAQAQTFSGAMAVLGNAVSDVKESLGNVITQNPAVIKGIQMLAIGFQKLGEFVNQNSTAMKALVRDVFVWLLGLIPPLVKGLGFINDAFFGMKTALNLITQALIKVNPLLAVALKLAGIDAKSLKESADAAEIAYVQRARVLDDLSVKVDNGIKQTQDQIAATNLETKSFIANTKAKIAVVKALSDEEQKSNVQKLAQNPALALTGGGGLKEGGTAKQAQDQNIAAAIGGIGSMLDGMQGAVKLASGLVSGIADTLLPGIGGVAGKIFEVLAQGPEKVKQMITEFFKAIPVILQNVVASIPVLIQTIIQSIPALVESIIFEFVLRVPEIILAFIEGLPALIEGLLEGLIGIIDRLAEEAPKIIARLIQEIPRVVQELLNKIPEIAIKFGIEMAAQAPFIAITFVTELIKQIPTIVKAFVEQITKQFSGQGIANTAKSAGGALSGIGKSFGKLFGFAEGGMVPPGFANDTFPAKLTSGEFVVNNDLTKKLTDFLSGNGGSQNLTVNLVVGEAQLAQAILNLNQRGFRTV